MSSVNHHLELLVGVSIHGLEVEDLRCRELREPRDVHAVLSVGHRTAAGNMLVEYFVILKKLLSFLLSYSPPGASGIRGSLQ